MPSRSESLDDSEVLATLELATVFVRDLDGTIRFWSAGCAKLYGWSAEEAIGQSAHVLLRTEFPIPLERLQAVLAEQGEWTGDLRHRRRDGSSIIVEAHKICRTTEHGRGTVMESVTDVTELRRMEAELRRLNASLEVQIAEEIARREAVQHRIQQSEKLAALNDLAGGLAHDFNNVLQAVSGLGSIIGRRAGDETVQRLAGLVDEAVNRGTAVTRRLLSFTRRGELRAEPVDIKAVLTNLQATIQQRYGSAITVMIDLDQDAPAALADSGQFEGALLNLATNACDAMAGFGSLTLIICCVAASDAAENLHPGDYVRIDVRDSGIGMSPETLRRAVEPFFTTKPRREGTGLGLSMVKSFADNSGGSLSLASTLGQGTTATIWLPVATAPAVPVAEIDRVAASGADAPTVLVVDDEELVREVIADELRDRGFHVIEADGGAAAIEIIDANKTVSLLISDLAMPGMSGNVLIRETHRRRPGLPAILLTGYAGDELDPCVTGSYRLLHKPITGAQLASHISSLLAPSIN